MSFIDGQILFILTVDYRYAHGSWLNWTKGLLYLDCYAKILVQETPVVNNYLFLMI